MKDIIAGLNKDFIKLVEGEGKELRKLDALLANTHDKIKFFEDHWEGAWMREDYDHYSALNGSNDFNTYKVAPDNIYQHIKESTKVDLQRVSNEIRAKVDAFQNFNNTIISDLSFIRDEEKFKQEAQLLEKLEKYEWGSNISEVISLYRPKSMMVYDVSQINRGVQTPPHIFVMADVLSLTTKCVACNKYADLAKRVLRQVEIKVGVKKSNTNEETLTAIFNNFHQFASQLKNRHNNRDTIYIEDEYDVQDLIHAILKLHFNDVRAEEYTPSYAGSSTRMDFLLKNEEIVIEVKKTRSSLKDKEIGEQLILDIAHYKNHPDCSILYCFVYDPENKVKNPRGIEKDISKLSNDNLQVNVFIRP